MVWPVLSLVSRLYADRHVVKRPERWVARDRARTKLRKLALAIPSVRREMLDETEENPPATTCAWP